MTLPKNQTKPKIVGLTLHYCVFSDLFFKSLPLCSEQFFFDLNDKFTIISKNMKVSQVHEKNVP